MKADRIMFTIGDINTNTMKNSVITYRVEETGLISGNWGYREVQLCSYRLYHGGSEHEVYDQPHCHHLPRVRQAIERIGRWCNILGGARCEPAGTCAENSTGVDQTVHMQYDVAHVQNGFFVGSTAGM
jgi:hypothetical protein